jgi:hypothetical protein
MLTASEAEWLRVRGYLQEHRYELGIRAADRYPSARRVEGTPLLADPSWCPATPVPLDDIGLSLAEEGGFVRYRDLMDAAGRAVPRRADGSRYGSYSQAMAELDAPAVFEDRPLYRLSRADLAGTRPALQFGLGSYFEGIDTGTAAAHELAASEAGLPGHPGDPTLRAALGNPCDLRARPATVAVATLTLRVDRSSGTAAFPLHWRDPAKVGHAGGMYMVVPTGIFQPSGLASWNVPNDFDLWRCMLREYAEELLGADEDRGSERAPIDYAAWPFGKRMSDARAAGQIGAWCVGLGVDPLTFATDLLTVVTFDAPVYDSLFGPPGGAARDNAEGTVTGSWPFDVTTVSSLLGSYPMQAAGAALLALAIRHAGVLLS